MCCLTFSKTAAFGDQRLIPMQITLSVLQADPLRENLIKVRKVAHFRQIYLTRSHKIFPESFEGLNILRTHYVK